jgi:transposase InsO family protein
MGEEREKEFSVRKMCAWLGISRSGYYGWRARRPSATAVWREQVTVAVRAVFDGSDETYGYRRVGAQLRREGVAVSDEVVRRTMRDLGLVPCQPRPWRPTTTVPADGDAPDLVRRDFTADAPFTKTVGDITYVKTWEGWAYLATVLDCHSKKVLGYAMADHMRTELVRDALAMAVKNSPNGLSGAVFHSDRGSQYMSDELARFCRKRRVARSVGRTGVCWDNAWAESFNGTLKNELCHRTRYPTREHAIKDVTRWIELVYNQRRIHSAIGYRTPNEVEREWLESRTAA